MNLYRLLLANVALWGCALILGGYSASALEPSASTRSPSQSELKDDHDPKSRPSLGELIRHLAGESVQDERAARSSEALNEEADENPNQMTDEEAAAAASRKRSTEAQLRRLKKPLQEIRIMTAELGGPLPENIAAKYSPKQPQIFITASGASPPRPNRYTIGFRHRPLYYEQRNLERCGRSCGYFQNAISGIQFLANTMVLPYHMGQEPACCPIPAGGDCMTCQSYPRDLDLLPLSCHGSVAEVAGIAGFSFLLL
jgi:hypothetical protein